MVAAAARPSRTQKRCVCVCARERERGRLEGKAGGKKRTRPAHPLLSSLPQSDRDLVAAVFRLQTDVARLKADVDRLGGPADTVELRRRLATAAASTQDAAATASSRVAAAHRARPTARTAKAAADCEAAVRDFADTLALMRRREAASLPRAPAKPVAAAVVPSTEGQQQQQQQAQAQAAAAAVDYQASLIAERGAAVDALTRQIGEVQEIFTDLATLVSDQGALVDDVEANIGAVAARASGARSELVRAERSQRAARNRRLIVLGVVACVLAVLVLVLSS